MKNSLVVITLPLSKVLLLLVEVFKVVLLIIWEPILENVQYFCREPQKTKNFQAYQNSWGLSTRVIGVMIMTHSDNKGLVLPPRIAQYQAVVIPVGLTSKSTDAQRKEINEGAEKIEQSLRANGIRVTGDYREIYNPGWKFADWELKGSHYVLNLVLKIWLVIKLPLLEEMMGRNTRLN